MSGAAGMLAWGARALKREMLDFRFEVPIHVVPDARDRVSLHYYIRADCLFVDAMELDVDGVPRHRSRTFTTYNPACVAW